MIKINLAPTAAQGATSTSSSMSFGSSSSSMSDVFVGPEEIRKEGLKRLLILLLGPLALFVYENQNVPAKNAEIAAKRQILIEMQAYNAKQAASVAEIKKFKEDEATIEKRISALEKISKDRQREIRVMDLLQLIIPEKAWLSRVQLNPDRVNVQGYALSDLDVSTLLEGLTRSALLMDVNLVSSSEVSQDGVMLKKFEISCLLERPE
ncbi:MAG: PilN domain-containing protein [Bdellovibrio sp.]|nr:PilN domain-containing protein [Bdellovibrio sp.]